MKTFGGITHIRKRALPILITTHTVSLAG
jgi:hypothetical protein